MVSMNQMTPSVSDLKLYIKDVRDHYGKKRPLIVPPWSTIKDVKDALRKLLHVPPSSQRLYFGPLMIAPLPNHRSLHDAGIYKSGETLLLDIKGSVVEEGYSTISSRPSTSDICVCSSMIDLTYRPLMKIVQKARRGLVLGFKPVLVLDGTGGTYFLHDARKAKVAVFKPGDEEPYAENNPRGYVKHSVGGSNGYEEDVSMRSGIKPGESCIREVAAYLLDHGGFSGVPMTTLAEAKHPAFNTNGDSANEVTMGGHSLSTASNNNVLTKVGSLQEFINSDGTMDDFSPSKISVEDVHRIAILDIRLMNADRNAANLLCHRNRDNSLSITPIDHGYCLRSVCDVSWFDWCWLDWPQLKKPLSKKARDYVSSLDIEADVFLLKERLNIGQDALDNFRASSKLLKAGVQLGLSLYDIALMCCRNDNAGMVRSKLEKITLQATELSNIAVENGKWHHIAASHALAEQISNSYTIDSFSSYKKSCNIFSPFNGSHNRMLTSGSESNSDAEDMDQDECDEWAASIIADVRNFNDQSSDRSRSTSIGSNSSAYSDTSKFSSSPVGFWYVRPGSNYSSAHSSNETWSPSGSFLKSKDFEFPSPPKDFAQPEDLSSLCESPFFSRKKSLPETPTSSPLPAAKGLVRSQSFSVLPSFATTSKNTFPREKKIDEDYEQYHIYYLKFIDLLIEREIRFRYVGVTNAT